MESKRNKAAQRWIVSSSAVISWRAGRIELESLTTGATFQTDNPDILRLLHAFARGASIDEVVGRLSGYAPRQIVTCIDELVECGIVTNALEEETRATHRWERTALAFHRKSRRHEFQTRRLFDRCPVAVPGSRLRIPLAPPSCGKGRDFSEVLELRRSRRAWPKKHPIVHPVFSTFLWMSARNRTSALEDLSPHDVKRPYPSGGAIYSLELFPIIAPRAVESIAAGVYRYDPGSHQLELLSNQSGMYNPFLTAAARSAASNPPPVALVITSRIGMQSEAYGDLGYSLVLKEVGALFQTFYLVAEYLDLAACALGGGMPGELLARLCDTTELNQPVVGEFMLGPR